MSDLTKYIRENFPNDETTDPKLFLLCDEVEEFEEQAVQLTWKVHELKHERNLQRLEAAKVKP